MMQHSNDNRGDYADFERIANEQGAHVVPPRSPWPDPDYGYIYLGSPYSLYAGGHQAAADAAAQAAASLMRRGYVVYSPIVHGHALAAHSLPLDWAFWKRQCGPLLVRASGLVVLMLDGWRDSVGLTWEIDVARKAGKPVWFMEPVSGEMEVAA